LELSGAQILQPFGDLREIALVVLIGEQGPPPLREAVPFDRLTVAKAAGPRLGLCAVGAAAEG
jgi:hypothetical protein